MQTKIIDALLGENANGEAILNSVPGWEAYEAARHVIEGIIDNEAVNGHGTYGTWTDGAHAIAAFGLGEEFAKLTEEEQAAALPLITAGIDRALRILSDVGHLGDRAILVADEIERLSDKDFDEKALIAIEEQLVAEHATGSTTRFFDCVPNEGFELEINGIWFGYRYAIPLDAIHDAARDGYTDDEWEALSGDERETIESDVARQIVAEELEEGVIGEMLEQVSRQRESKLESAETMLSFIRHQDIDQAA